MTKSMLPRTLLIAAATGLCGYFIGKLSQPPGPPVAARIVQDQGSLTSGNSISQRSKVQMDSKVASKETAGQTHATISPEVEAKLLRLLARPERSPTGFNLGEELVAWLAASPDEVVAFLAPSSQRDHVFQQLFAAWGKKDPLAASQWVADHAGAPGRDSIAAGLASGVAKEDPQAALKWAASINDPLLKLNAAAEVGWELYRANEAGAVEGVKSIGLPDSAMESLNSKWQQRFSSQMKRNSQNIASTATAARAAGANLDTSSLESVLTALRKGVSGSGAFKNTSFQLSTENWTDREWAAIGRSIEIKEGVVSYQHGY
jgi:hypothetical protein